MSADRGPLLPVRRTAGISLFRLRRRIERTPPKSVLDERQRRLVDAFHRLDYEGHEQPGRAHDLQPVRTPAPQA